MLPLLIARPCLAQWRSSPAALRWVFASTLKTANYVPSMRQVFSGHAEVSPLTNTQTLFCQSSFADMPGVAKLKRTTCSHSTLPVESDVMPRHHALDYKLRACYNSPRTCQGLELAAQQKLVMRLSGGPFS